MTTEDENVRLMSTPIRRVFMMAAIVALLPLRLASGADPESLEYRVKAAFLLNFGKFVEWPNAGRAAGRPFSFCVLGSDSFGHVLESTIAGKTIGDRPTEVRRLKTASEAKTCQVVFIAASERGRMQQILQALSDEPVLTVSEIPGFAERGGMINFVLKDNRVQFEINPERAVRARLRISSHLLRLASVVGMAQSAAR